MMRPSLPPPPGDDDKLPCSSVFDAIKDDDWEGLLTLYATTAYDAVRSAEFSRRGDFDRRNSSPPSFRDEKKTEGATYEPASSFHQGSCKKSPSHASNHASSPSSIRELDLIVREIIGVEPFDEHYQGSVSCNDTTTTTTAVALSQRLNNGDNHVHNSKLSSSPSSSLSSSQSQCHDGQRTSKKTRLHSSPPPSARKSSPGGLSSALDHILFHGHHHSSSSPSPSALNGSKNVERGSTDWERIMWDSASALSNARPSPSFVVRRRDRDRREAMNDESGGVEGEYPRGTFDSVEGVLICHRADKENDDVKREGGGDDDDEKNNPSSALIFEGNVANATPGEHRAVLDGLVPPAPQPLGGAGTAQHLACLLDSPFSLALLICLGVDCEARHTAFRRLAVHETACADSPKCLELLMEVGGSASDRLYRESLAVAESLKSPFSAHSFAVCPSSGLKSSAESFSGEIEERVNRPPSKKSPKKKLNLFSGWHKGKAPGVGGAPSSSSSYISKKSSHDEQYCEMKSPSPAPPEFTSFPAALKVMWDAVKFLRSGLMNEMEAAHYVLDRVKISDSTMMALASQCPHLPPLEPLGRETGAATAPVATSSSPSPFASIPGLPAAVHQLFQQQPPNNTNASNNGHVRDNNMQPPLLQGPFPKRNNVDGHGNTPLHWAAFKNSVRAMDVLLSRRHYGGQPSEHRYVDHIALMVNVRAQPSGWTPLHDAAYSDAADAVTRLIAAGADVDARSHSGATPLCFAAQEDAPNATKRLLEAGADPEVRCLGNSPGVHVRANNADNGQFHSRFSGYTPLHYCAHYNAARAARVLLEHGVSHSDADGLRRGRSSSHGSGHDRRNLDRSLSHPLPSASDRGVSLLEIPDLNEKLPIHVAAARGSSRVLRELLHGGARVETRTTMKALSLPHRPLSLPASILSNGGNGTGAMGGTAPLAIPRSNNEVTAAANSNNAEAPGSPDSVASSTLSRAPVSSPVLRAMIPSAPIRSSKPWNCLSQKSIDACKHLIEEAEMEWAPGRHGLFAPRDRAAVVEVLRVGKRLERMGLEVYGLEEPGRGIFLDLWPRVLSFCGRGWFEPEAGSEERGKEEEERDMDGKEAPLVREGQDRRAREREEEISMRRSTSSDGSARGAESDDAMEEEFTQFQLDEASDAMAAIL
eukprot:CAMPEP_0172538174 /NCGR_PEP_ID=MMETSP1067-20121228/9623_1 /TAXON_ID=265564 ORGANISM="Thalassiosira punctigera, Strain Tpunct2005C2" /NCGR_SAMPLE_ID=MMETSP1067 /ASSEMBLY_ACC=CAM_ASM_000444 /LENGTH=1157 /DNA_ID=CAMNT_0013323625 /DNA_START=81 /DNA_END=3554 /DNA_ORIENTATION=-